MEASGAHKKFFSRAAAQVANVLQAEKRFYIRILSSLNWQLRLNMFCLLRIGSSEFIYHPHCSPDVTCPPKSGPVGKLVRSWLRHHV